jgi:hypothetical protein
MSTNDQKDAVRRKLAYNLKARTTRPRGAGLPRSSGEGNAAEDRRSEEDTLSREGRTEQP